MSTSGLAHKIRDFANEGVQVNLAVSLHAPNNDLRSSIMKINRAFPIEKLFAAIEYYIETTNRRVTFEYIMLNEVNDGVEQALELAELLKNIKKLSYVNLIPYNPVSEHDQYSRSPKERVMAFYDTLKKQGVNCVVRQEHGTDIDAACGQLRSNTMKRDREKAIVEHDATLNKADRSYRTNQKRKKAVTEWQLLLFYPFVSDVFLPQQPEARYGNTGYSTFRSHRRPAGSS